MTALGRGLSAILGDTNEDNLVLARTEIAKVSLEEIRSGRYQPRSFFDEEGLEALVASVKEKGVLQPIIVRPCLGERDVHYEVVAGERRWRAAKKANLHEVPVIIKDLSDAEALEIAIIENVQRQDLNPLEEAEGYQRLIDEFHHTQEALGKVIGKSRSHITNTLRLLLLPEKIKSYMLKGQLTAGHARTLIASPDAELLAEKIIKQGLSVRQAEKIIQEKKENKPNKIKPVRKKTTSSYKSSDDYQALGEMISHSIGLETIITGQGEQGHVVIYFNTLDDLDAVLEKLST